jgi:multicomponent Na+:H+ antiporter subunit B
MHGHSSPGGGFQGGVILGASFILLGMAYGLDEVKRRFSLKNLTIFVSLGVFLYAGIGLLCLLLGQNFLNYGVLPIPLPRYMGMFGIELGVGITVMAVMVSLFHDLVDFE